MASIWSRNATPAEKAMGVLIHDFNQRSYGLRKAIQDLRSGECTPEQVARNLEATEKLLNKTIDEYYIKFQADFPA